MPDAVATPPLIVHEVGTSTAGFSPVDDSGTEIRSGMVMDGPKEEARPADADTTAVKVDVSGDVLVIKLDAEALGDGEALTGGGTLLDEGCVTAAGWAAEATLRLPACLPTKNTPTHKPTMPTNPRTDSVRLLARVIELAYAPDPSTSNLAWATTD